MIEAAAGESTRKSGGIWLSRLVGVFLFLLFTVAIFQFPEHPQLGLDPSWKMALGQTFHDGHQFGRDVVYNYGPLGFLMGNTFFGLQFWSLIVWQLLAAMIFSALIIRNAGGLRWEFRILYVLVFLVYGIIYPDVLYMVAIALMGLELIRRDQWAWPVAALFAFFFAAISLMKFTNLLFAVCVTAVVFFYRMWSGRLREAAWFAGCFCGGFFILWMLSRQNPLNIPAYLANSWQISTGYEDTMGTPAPLRVLWKALAVIVILCVYLILHIILQRNKPRALASSAVLAAFLFLDWKHGFVRADAHMLVFFISALVPVVAFPALLDDPPRLRWLQRSVLLGAGALSILAMRNVMQTEETDPPYVRADLRESIVDNISHTLHWASFRESYDTSLRDEKDKYDLPLMRKTIGGGTVDIIGNEQAVAFYNGFHYSPRPVFQSFAAYTPRLEQLNETFFESGNAPGFVLLKIQTIDDRLAALDDATVLRTLPVHYEFTNIEEHGWMLWKHHAAPAQSAPPELRSDSIPFNTPLPLGDLGSKNLWVTIDVTPSFSGRLLRFLYKPVMVKLTVGLDDKTANTYMMPLSQALAGFILNPLIENNADYLAFVKGESTRRIRSLEIEVADDDKRFFTGPAHVRFSELPPATQ